MKKNIFNLALLIALSLFVFQAYAQKRNIDDTWFAIKNNEISRAKQSIDEAYTHESTRGTARMFLFRGKVYLIIADRARNDSAYLDMDPNPELVAAESFISFFESPEKKKKVDLHEAHEYVPAAASLALNKAASFQENGHLKGSIEMLEKVITLMKYDKEEELLKQGISENKILLNLYATASEAGELELSRNYLNRLIDNGYDNPDIFIYLARTYFESGDSATALTTLEEGRKVYPDDRNILIEEINYYLLKDETNTLLDKFNEAIEADPENERFYFFRGTLFHQKKLYDFAEKDYLKCLEMNPYAMDVKFNIGAMYVEMTAPIIDEMNANLANLNKYDQLEKERNDLYFKALPYLEEAYESGDIEDGPEKIKLLEILRDTYKIKRDREKIRYFQTEIERIKGA